MTYELRDWWFLNHQVFLLWDQAWRPLLNSQRTGIGRFSSKFKMEARELESSSVLLMVSLKWVCVSQGEGFDIFFHSTWNTSHQPFTQCVLPFLWMGISHVKSSPPVSPSCSQIPLHQCKFLFVNVLKADCKLLESILLVPLTSW